MLWRNPHAALTVRARDANGAVTDWAVETSSLTVLKRMGIDEGTIKVGDRIKLAGNPAVGPKKEMYARNVLLPDGRELLLNVGLKPRWTEHAVGDESLLMAEEGDPSRPDLGLFRVWSHTRAIPRLFPEVVDSKVDIQSYPMTEAARAALAKFNRATDNPTANCVPKGMPTIMEAPYPIEFVQPRRRRRAAEARGVRPRAARSTCARTAPPAGTRREPARLFGRALGRPRARRDDDEDQLAVLQPTRDSAEPERDRSSSGSRRPTTAAASTTR